MSEPEPHSHARCRQVPRRRQRPARLPLPAADPQAARPWVLLAAFAIAAGSRWPRPRRPGDRRRSAAAGALLVGLARRLRDRRLARRGRLLRRLRRRSADWPLGGRRTLPAATPLLRKGDDRYAERSLAGPLGDGVDGILALYTYEEKTTDSEGNRADQLLPLHGRHRRGPRVRRTTSPSSTASASSACTRWRSSRTPSAAPKRVELESEALDDATRSSPTKSRTRSGCASSSPPPSSSG